MKNLFAVIMVTLALSVLSQTTGTVVQDVQRVDAQTAAGLVAFKQRVAAANPNLEVMKVEADVVQHAVLAPRYQDKTPTIAIFVKNQTKTPGMDDEVDGIRDRLATEIAGLGLRILDPVEIVAAFSRAKVTTREERDQLVTGLFQGGSVMRLAQMVEADYVLTASIIGASSQKRQVGDRNVTVYTLRMSTKVIDASTGTSVFGKNWSGKVPAPPARDGGGEALSRYGDLVDDWVSVVGTELAAAGAQWKKPTADAGLVSFTVTTTLDDVFKPLETTVDASKPVKDELRVVAGGCTVEIDGATIGSSGGVFKVRPGLHQMRVNRPWMTAWTGTVNIVEGASFFVALELNAEGLRHYRDKETLRAELAVRYAEAACLRGCRVNFDSSNWQNVTVTSGARAANVSSVTVTPPIAVQPLVQSK